MRSLVVAPQWIGDAVMTEPLMRRLHARGERLTVGALPWVAPVYRAMPQVAEVVEFPFAHGGLQLRARRVLARQFAGQVDVAYVLPNSIKSALLPLLAGIPKRVGYLGEVRVGILTHRLKNPPKSERPPMVAFYSRLSGDAPDEVVEDQPKLHVSDADLRSALETLNLQSGRYYVFAPGAEYGPAKRWPTAHYATLAQQLDLPVVLLGSAKEALLCDEIAAASANCINLAGKTTLAHAFAAIACAKAVVSNDSGLMHVAAAFRVPQVAVFGSSSPIHTPPLSARATVLWLKTDPLYAPPLDCAPCFQRECPLPLGQGHLRCLTDVRPHMVWEKLQGSVGK